MTGKLEELARAVHQSYLDTCARLGWSVKPENAVPYSDLSDDAKELDRATTRAILEALREPDDAALEAAASVGLAMELAVKPYSQSEDAGGKPGIDRNGPYMKAHRALIDHILKKG